VQKFYRINGGSTQLKGVTPDIVLPDRFSHIETGEKELDYPMPWTELPPVAYKQDIVDLSPINLIKKQSSERVAGSEEFKLVEENARRIQHMRDQSKLPLHLDKYQNLMKSQEEDAARFKDIFTKREDLVINNLPEDLDYIQMDSSRIGRNDAWLRNIQKDPYIDETLWIMHDMIRAGVALYEPRTRKE
jgi:carboxyl-terminal processing protease